MLLRQLFFWLALALAGTAHAALRIEHWTTSTGARVYFVESRAIPALDVAVEFPAGSGWDPVGGAGTARLTVAMLKAGSARFSESESTRRLADIGAQLSETLDRDRAGFALRTLSSPAERGQALEILADMLQSPQLPEGALERERARAIAAVRETEARPDGAAERRLYRLMYPGHGYGNLATLESLGGITRAQIERYHRDHYRGRRAVVTLVGDLDQDTARKVAELLTAGLPPGDAGPARIAPAAPLAGAVSDRIERPSAQSHVLLGVPALSRDDPDYFPLFVGNYILGGGGFVSRLYKEIRVKRGFAYSVYSYFYPLEGQGPFLMGLQTRNDQAAEALVQTRKVMEEFIARGPTESELSAARRGLIGGFPLRIDSNRKILEQVAAIGFYRLPLDWLDRFTANVQLVTLERVRSAFARHVDPARLATVVVGAQN